MARIIVFASSKGGTGKTTMVANVGVAMAQLKRKAVLLDADIMMANLGLFLGLEEQEVTLHEVLAGESKLSEAISIGQEGVRVVPSGVSLEGIQKAKLERLKKVVKELSKKFEFLLIDAPSGLGRDAIAAITIAKEMVLVVTPDIASLSNAFKTKLIAERLNVEPLGVVVTRITGKDFEIPTEKINSTMELPVLASIPEDPAVRRSVALGEPVVIHNPKSKAAKEMKKLAEKLVNLSSTC
ncbi:MAG TPA: septum site-determining protein MinD [Hadesarchaea archaeon]|nr:septum site-determining protein MinD [Hadesarchaea archaeon]